MKRLAAILGVIALTGCGSSSSSPTSPSASGGSVDAFQGTFAGLNGQVGTISFSPGSPATGTLRQSGGATTSLTGTYSGGSVSLSGGGFSLSGTGASGVIYGNYTSSSGNGGFSVQNSSSVTAYCGKLGQMGMALTISSAGNVVGQTSSLSCLISGKVSGDQVQFHCQSVANSDQSGTLANGTISGTTLTPAGFPQQWTLNVC